VSLQIRTRDHLLQQLQTHLDDVGAALHADFSLTFTGFSNESDVVAAQRLLERGDTKISELFRLQA